MEKLGYFLKPGGFFSEVAKRGVGNNKDIDQFDETKTNFILERPSKNLNQHPVEYNG